MRGDAWLYMSCLRLSSVSKLLKRRFNHKEYGYIISACKPAMKVAYIATVPPVLPSLYYHNAWLLYSDLLSKLNTISEN